MTRDRVVRSVASHLAVTSDYQSNRRQQTSLEARGRGDVDREDNCSSKQPPPVNYFVSVAPVVKLQKSPPQCGYLVDRHGHEHRTAGWSISSISGGQRL